MSSCSNSNLYCDSYKEDIAASNEYNWPLLQVEPLRNSDRKFARVAWLRSKIKVVPRLLSYTRIFALLTLDKVHATSHSPCTTASLQGSAITLQVSCEPQWEETRLPLGGVTGVIFWLGSMWKTSTCLGGFFTALW